MQVMPLARLAACAIASCISSVAFAEPECRSDLPWIAITVDPTMTREAERVRRELRADLAPQAIEVCDASRVGTPIARVVLSRASEGVSIRVEVHDALTAKELARTLNTENIPADGHAVAVALATGELLRASWAELALAFAPPPARAVPAPVSRIVDTSLARGKSHARIVGLGVAFATEAFTSGFARFGADARVSVDVVPRFTASVRAGFRRALPVTAPDGTITADALVFGGEGSVPLFARDARWNLDLLARLDVAAISFSATPLGGANASAATLASFEASGGARATLSLTEALRLSLEGGAGGAIVAANARDGGTIVSGTNGALFFGALALVGKF